MIKLAKMLLWNYDSIAGRDFPRPARSIDFESRVVGGECIEQYAQLVSYVYKSQILTRND